MGRKLEDCERLILRKGEWEEEEEEEEEDLN